MSALTPVPEWLETWNPEKSANEPTRMSKQDLLSTLKQAPKSVTVVDLRNERETGYITQAVHIPATVIHGPKDVQEKLVAPVLAKFPDTEKIVIHCNGSRQRASLVGGWTKDHLEQYGPKNVEIEILHEGIVGWLAGDDEFKSETTML